MRVVVELWMAELARWNRDRYEGREGGCKTYPCHEDDAVDAHFPLLPQHLLGLLPEDAGGVGLLSGCAGGDELL